MLSQFRRNCTPMPSLFRLASAAIKARAESLRPPLPPPPLPSALPSPLIKSVSPDKCATYCHRSPATAKRPTRTICTSGKVNARCGVGKIKINRGQHVVGQRKSWPKNAETSLKSLRQSEFCGTYVGRVPRVGDYLCEMLKPDAVGQHCDNPIRHMCQPLLSGHLFCCFPTYLIIERLEILQFSSSSP